MTDLAPSPELVYRLRDNAPYGNLDGGTKRELHLIDAAYRAGADQELEACVKWLNRQRWEALAIHLRATRRPNPPSLKEQALTVLDDASDRLDAVHENTIRRALEALPNE